MLPRARHTVYLAIIYALAYVTIVGTTFWLLAPRFIALLHPTAEILQEGVRCLRFMVMGYAFLAINTIINFSCIGAGDPKAPLFFDTFNRWVCRILGGYLLSRVVWARAIRYLAGDIPGRIGAYASCLLLLAPLPLGKNQALGRSRKEIT